MRFLAVVLNNKHFDEEDDAFEYRGYAVIRSSDEGVTDSEFEAGARISFYDERSDYAIRRCLETDEYHVLDLDAWNAMIEEINGADLPQDKFITRPKTDKWDTRPEIY